MSYKCYKAHFELEPFRLNDGYPFLHPYDMRNGITFKPYDVYYINWHSVNYIVVEEILNSETNLKQEYLYINFGDSELNMDASYLNEIVSNKFIIEVGETDKSKRVFVNKDNLVFVHCSGEDNYYSKKDEEKIFFKEYWFDFKNSKDSFQVLSKNAICL